MNPGGGRRWTPVLVLVAATVIGWVVAYTVYLPHEWMRRCLHVLVLGQWSAAVTWWLIEVLPRRLALPCAMLIGLAAAAASEWVQRWMPPHDPEWIGFWFSVAGVVTGWSVVVLVRRWAKA